MKFKVKETEILDENVFYVTAKKEDTMGQRIIS